ncbi:MAG: DNA polymerase/3'-5' exonuclease PolX [Mariniblastus sp.]|nr:DNA polymerase/3'-5' exonuclease PolX [Mariniblastus sp.]
MTNQKIAQTLEMLADLLEFQGANAFRLRAYRNGARVIREMPDSIEKLLENDQDLAEFDGIGKGVAAKCQELVETGKLEQLEQILEEVPRSVLDLLNVPKLGPKKAAALFNELGISSLEQLEAACREGQLQQLPGFGEKTEAAILAGIAIAVAANQRILWSDASLIVDQLREHMASAPALNQMEFAGSYRRGKETVGDLDLLVDSDCPQEVMDHFAKFDSIQSTIVRGETKMSVRLENEFQVDLRVVPGTSFGAALQYFTGSQAHNVLIRGQAKQRGLKVNEWGLFRVNSEGDDEWLAGRKETEIYEGLGLPWFPPEIREARVESEWAEVRPLPALIETGDICGDLHMHTTATDGRATLEEMVAAAKAIGLNYIAITDHSQRVTMAHGLDGDRLLAQWDAIDQLNRAANDEFLVLKGIECDILEAGGMDLPDDVLARADWVIASIHYGQQQSRQQITDRIVGALQHPHVSMLAHPTGRLINRREPYQVDMEAVFQAADENGKLLELNANPRRLDLNDVHLLAAKQRGIPVVINTDAHRTEGLEHMKYGVQQARRGCLVPADVANTLPWDELRQRIGRE